MKFFVYFHWNELTSKLEKNRLIGFFNQFIDLLINSFIDIYIITILISIQTDLVKHVNWRSQKPPRQKYFSHLNQRDSGPIFPVMKKTHNPKNNNPITKSRNLKPPRKSNQNNKLKPTTKTRNNKPESSPSTPRSILEVDSATWKLSKVALNQKSYKKRNSTSMPSEIHSTLEMNKAKKKNKPNNNKLSQQSKSQPPNNNNKKNNKSQRRRKTNSLNSKKLWRSSVWLKLPKVIRRKREPKKSKRPDNKQLNNNLLQKPNPPINQNNQQLKTSQSISNFFL